jgi:hypothetical protein
VHLIYGSHQTQVIIPTKNTGYYPNQKQRNGNKGMETKEWKQRNGNKGMETKEWKQRNDFFNGPFRIKDA